MYFGAICKWSEIKDRNWPKQRPKHKARRSFATLVSANKMKKKNSKVQRKRRNETKLRDANTKSKEVVQRGPRTSLTFPISPKTLPFFIGYIISFYMKISAEYNWYQWCESHYKKKLRCLWMFAKDVNYKIFAKKVNWKMQFTPPTSKTVIV